ncbi:hypothetical protein ACS0TY_026220 [Phlomoides rotata]
MGFEEKNGDGKSVSESNENRPYSEIQVEIGGRVSRQMSEVSPYTTEDEDDDDTGLEIQLGPLCTLKELSEKDKDDESLRRWKE